MISIKWVDPLKAAFVGNYHGYVASAFLQFQLSSKLGVIFYLFLKLLDSRLLALNSPKLHVCFLYQNRALLPIVLSL